VEDDLAGMAELSSDEEEAEEPEAGPVTTTATPAERKKKAPKEPVVPTGPPLPPPLLEGEGKSLKVLGFSHKQRTTFVKVGECAASVTCTDPYSS
jgi:chromodomain-helicase-DNA-binding protein 4